MKLIDLTHSKLQPGRSWFTTPTVNKKVLTVHHDAIPLDNRSDAEIIDQIYRTHVNNGWPGFAYCYFYSPKTRTWYKMNNHEDVTWHDAVNWDSIGLIIHGYYHPDIDNKPTKETLADLKEMLDYMSTQFPEFPADQDDVYGHRERSSTACPGNHLIPYVQEYRNKKGDVNWLSVNPPSSMITIESSLYEKLVNGSTVRKEVAEYLAIPNPDNASREQIISVIAGIKSNVTTLQRRIDDIQIELAKETSERQNRDEQVGRLKTELTELAKVHKEEVDKLQKIIDTMPSDDGLWKGKYEVEHERYVEAMKDKGTLQNELAVAKQQLENCEHSGGTTGPSLWDVIKDFLSKFKMVS